MVGTEDAACGLAAPFPHIVARTAFPLKLSFHSQLVQGRDTPSRHHRTRGDESHLQPEAKVEAVRLETLSKQ